MICAWLAEVSQACRIPSIQLGLTMVTAPAGCPDAWRCRAHRGEARLPGIGVGWARQTQQKRALTSATTWIIIANDGDDQQQAMWRAFRATIRQVPERLRCVAEAQDMVLRFAGSPTSSGVSANFLEMWRD